VDDLRLLERVRRGDETAFDALYAAHHPAIYRYAFRMCGQAAADDVVQETFLALLRRPEGFERGRGTLLNYLFGIARHHVGRHLAASGAQAALDDNDAVEDACWAVDLSPLDDLSRAETVEAVRTAIQSLPPLYREAVVLCELQEMDYASAASVMACPVGTVRSRLHRARALLASKLAAATERQPLRRQVV
jgi:RNA polymerase sigma-70 factor (ECF subfamily)